MRNERTISYEDIYVEPSKVQIAEIFIDETEELSGLNDEERSLMVEYVAKMATAGEVFVFDQEVGARHVSSQLYELDDQGEKAVLMITEKKDDGIESAVTWVDREKLLSVGFSEDEIVSLGFSPLS
jgi:hypothetical protein